MGKRKKKNKDKQLAKKPKMDPTDIFKVELALHILSVPHARDAVDYVRSLVTESLFYSPVLLEGPVSCGKTAIVQFLAREFGHRLVKVQVNEQTDAKSLVGSYCCSAVPGYFTWRPGCLWRATKRGDWLLLEDIDLAPPDVASLLLPFFETGKLPAGFGAAAELHAVEPRFRLFATRRLRRGVDGFHASVSTGRQLLEKAWSVVRLDAFDEACLKEIIVARFPLVEAIRENVFNALWTLTQRPSGPHSGSEDVRSVSRRLLSSRDLLKICSRLQSRADGQATDWLLRQAETVFLEAFDCLAANIPKPAERQAFAMELAGPLNLGTSRVQGLLASRCPEVFESGGSLEVGRWKLKKRTAEKDGDFVGISVRPEEQSASIGPTRRYPFALTRQACLLLEQLAGCVHRAEPALLVGETGCGKTACVQRLAAALGHKLRVINMNQQSDTADLLGGYKPVELQHVVRPVKDTFVDLFVRTFNRDGRNDKFLGYVHDCFRRRSWSYLLELFKKPLGEALKKINNDALADVSLASGWRGLQDQLSDLRRTVRAGESALAFSFVEGSLVRALRAGEWVLLDEVNLAPADMLECLSGLLEEGQGSVTLTERGDTEPVQRHPDFRLFACMNPATDVGKRDLPFGLRSRFTELFVDEPDTAADLVPLVSHYLTPLCLPLDQIRSIVEFYLQLRRSAVTLSDGSGKQPHFSLRSLCRALHTATSKVAGATGVQRALYEGFCYAFVTPLSSDCRLTVEKLVRKMVVQMRGDEKTTLAHLSRPMKCPLEGWVDVEGYWIPGGPKREQSEHRYVITEAVRRNLKDLARVVSIGQMPVLLEGETSVGKTSLIRYLAQLVGQTCLRVNNHEHTDVQEYIGCYAASGTDGRLTFQEGVLVEAMRHGYWIILDELNLAPTDILEALNRVLDDNRELFITETQDCVRAHPNFMLFATQNPAGGRYGGRKPLSRALRNRFVELYLDPLPSEDLKQILVERCHIPASRAAKLVQAMIQLQTRRRESSLFHGKESFMTLRDLFRWAERYRQAEESHVTRGAKYFDWDQYIAEQGFLLLAGRVRKASEVAEVREVLSSVFRRELDEQRLFALDSATSPCALEFLAPFCGAAGPPAGFEHLVWTRELRRLAVLVGNALKYEEPVLLVGETGCGKTSLCQLLAAHRSAQLLSINCHLHSEAADFIGGLRPVRGPSDGTGRLFEWSDGPLVRAMRSGDCLLVDEISLADDSVLERLNSVLEPERSLLVAERAGETLQAAKGFRLLATMNPGGDFGKKELSPALRNRFTEIWCPGTAAAADLRMIAAHNLHCGDQTDKEAVARVIVDFMAHLKGCTEEGAAPIHLTSRSSHISIRDLLSWVHFINASVEQLSVSEAVLHGAAMVFTDAWGAKPIEGELTSDIALSFLRARLRALCPSFPPPPSSLENPERLPMLDLQHKVFGVAPFCIQLGDTQTLGKGGELFAFDAPTARSNAFRLLRAMQVNKPLLLEGSPGVGKTSLVAALAHASGHKVVRINLSEQTDVSDLFGCDLPVEGGVGGEFRWRDGPLLQALKNGWWILLDEMNLASQAVLEALNACLDHRGEVFIPDLNATFVVRRGVTRLFACQNPLSEGGGRKGLPLSFLNRFSQVRLEPLTEEDQLLVLRRKYPLLSEEAVRAMIRFNEQISRAVIEERSFGLSGAPWEFNLRDLCRWAELMLFFQGKPKPKFEDANFEEDFNPGVFVPIIYTARFRTAEDKEKVSALWTSLYGSQFPLYVSTREIYKGRFCDPFCGRFSAAYSFGDCESSDEEAEANAEEPKEGEEMPEADAKEMEAEASAESPRKSPRKSLKSPEKEAKSKSPKAILRQKDSPRSSQQIVIKIIENKPKSPSKEQKSPAKGEKSPSKGEKSPAKGEKSPSKEQKSPNKGEKSPAKGEKSPDKEEQSPALIGEHPANIKWVEVRIASSSDDSSEEEDGRLARGSDPFDDRFFSLFLLLWQREALEAMLAAVRMKWFVILSGPRGSGKSALVTGLESLCNVKVRRLAVNANTDTTELLGSFEQGANGGRFRWVDSELVRALRCGDWLLVDNVNLCSPAVLDRLNGLLEPNGVLTLGERGLMPDGSVPVVHPHKNFRLFFLMDPSMGNPLSRAMRNRGLEVALLPPDWSNPVLPLDLQPLLYGAGEAWPCLLALQHRLMTAEAEGLLARGAGRFGVAGAVQAADEIKWRVARGEPLQEAFEAAVRRVCVEREWSDCNRQTLHTIVDEFMEVEFLNVKAAGPPELCQLSKPSSLMSYCDMDDYQMFDYLLYFVKAMWRQQKERLGELSEERQNLLGSILADIFNWRVVLYCRDRYLSEEAKKVPRPFLRAVCSLFSADDRWHEMRWRPCRGFSVMRERHCSAYVLKSALMPLLLRMGRLKEEEDEEEEEESTDEDSDDWEIGAKRRRTGFSISAYAPLRLRRAFRGLEMEHRYLVKNDFKVALELPAFLHQTLSQAYELEAKALSEDGVAFYENLLPLAARLFDLWRFVLEQPIVSSAEKFAQLTAYFVRRCYHRFAVLLGDSGDEEARENALKALRQRLKKLANKLPEKWRPLLPSKALLEDRALGGCDWRTLSIMRANERCARPPADDSEQRWGETFEARHTLNIWGESFITEIISNAGTYRPGGKGHKLLQAHASGCIDDVEAVHGSIYTTCASLTAEELPHVEAWPATAAIVRSVLALLPFFDGAAAREPLCAAVTRFCASAVVPDCFRLLMALRRADDAWGLSSEVEWFSFATASKRRADVLRSIRGRVTSAARGEDAEQRPDFDGQYIEADLKDAIAGGSLTSAILQLFGDEHCGEPMFARESLDSLTAQQLAVSRLHRHLLCVAPFITQPEALAADLAALKSEALDALRCVAAVLELDASLTLFPLLVALTKHKDVLERRLPFAAQLFKQLLVRLTRCRKPELATSEEVGAAFVVLGALQAALFLPRESLDPQVVLRLQVESLRAEASRLELEHDVRNSYSLISRGLPFRPEAHLPNDSHPYERAFVQRSNHVTKKLSDLEPRIAFRPDRDEFQMLRNRCLSFHKSNNEARDGALSLLKKLEAESEQEQSRVADEAGYYHARYFYFLVDLTNRFATNYRDITQPYLLGITQMMRGFRLIHSCMAPLADTERRRAKAAVLNLLRFPFLCSSGPGAPPTSTSLLCVVAFLLDANFLLWLEQHKSVTLRAVFLLAARLLSLDAACRPRVDAARRLEHARTLLDRSQAVWRAEEARRRREEAEAESLYRVREAGGDKAEAEAGRQLRAAFPDFGRDFEDLVGRDVLNAAPREEEEQQGPPRNAKEAATRRKDAAALYAELRGLFRGEAKAGRWSEEALEAAMLEAAREAFRLGAHLASACDIAFGPEDDRYLTMTHLALLARLREGPGCSRPPPLTSAAWLRPHFDIYTDSAPAELLRARPVLQELSVRVADLRRQFPEHAGLATIAGLTARLRSGVALGREALMKFVTGCELLLRAIDDWERNAAHFVSLMEPREGLLRVITDWRKLELSCWSASLEARQWRLHSEAICKWWPHLLDLFFLLRGAENEASTSSSEGLLIQFLEGASLGDFSVRLDLCRSLTAALRSSKEEQSQDTIRFLENAVAFYEQFEPEVKQRLESLKKPIDKEIKDFIKVMRWGDRSFWSLRASVDKSHKAIFKQIRAWDVALAESVASHLILPSAEGKEATTGKEESWKWPCEAVDSTGSLPGHLGRCGSLLRKLRLHFVELTENSVLAEPSEELAEMAERAAAESEELRKLQPKETKDLEAWRKQTGHIQSRKRAALSAFFKALSAAGVSYRRGLALRSSEASDLTALLRDLPLLPGALRSLHRRLFRSLARQTALEAAAAKPHSELGPAGADRCAGFSAHLFHQARGLCARAARAGAALEELRRSLQRLDTAVEEQGVEGCEEGELRRVRGTVAKMAADAELVLRQWRALLRAGTFKPCSGSGDTPMPVSDDCLPLLVRHESWEALSEQLTALVEPHLTEAERIASQDSTDVPLCSLKDRERVQAVLQLTEGLRDLHAEAFSVLQVAAMPHGATSGLLGSLFALQTRLQEDASDLRAWLQAAPQQEGTGSAAEVSEALNSSIEAVLLAVQRSLRSCNVPEAAMSAVTAACDRLAPCMEVPQLLPRLQQAESALRACRSPAALQEGLEALRGALPLLHNFLAASARLEGAAASAANAAFRLHSVSAAIFAQLLQHGFCKPEEPQEETGEAQEGAQLRDGCGMGEGSGLRDVSEEIENEAQLEGLRGEEGEEQQQQEDEKDGVEMSEDFEGAEHGPGEQKNEDEDKNEEEEQEEEEEEMDDKMGDLGDDEPEEVNREMWASDDEEETPKDREDKDRGQGVTEQNAEQELVAGDDATDLPEPPEGNEPQPEPQQEPNLEPEGEDKMAEDRTEEAGPQPQPEPLELNPDMRLDDEEEEPPADDAEGQDAEGEEDGEDAGEEEEIAPGGPEDTAEEEKKEEAEEEEESPAEGEASKQLQEEKEEEKTENKEEEDQTGPETLPGMEVPELPKEEEEVTGGAGGASGIDALPSSGSAAQEASSGAGGRPQAAGAKEEEKAAGRSLRRGAQGGGERPEETRKLREASERRSRAEGATEAARRVEETLEAGSSAPQEAELPDNTRDGLLEHLTPEEEVQKALQVMDTATADQARELAPPETEEKEEGRREERKEEEEEAMETEEAAPTVRNATAEGEVSASEAKAQEEKEKEEEVKEEEEREAAEAAVEMSAFFTRHEVLMPLPPDLMEELFDESSPGAVASSSAAEIPRERRQAAERAWGELEASTRGLARELTEQLRLILEPTLASKLRGDYRTGKRLNMRKVIPYVASHFRKDKIWLRRTKPHAREYRVLIAVDDSSSMRSNLCMEMTFKALSILTSSLGMLEVGRLGVCSFGSSVQFLHPLSSASPVDGPGLLAGFNFDQSQTALSALLHAACEAMAALPGGQAEQAPAAQLLLIISDGLCSEDTLSPKVRRAVREAREQQLFVVFLIIDSPRRKCPVFNVKKHVPAEKAHLLPARLREGKPGSRMVNYMEVFPFPFYLVLRDINALPLVLSDALRQWFELIASGSTS